MATITRSELKIEETVPYVMRLPNGAALFLSVPARLTVKDRGEGLAFTPAGMRYLDKLRALAMELPMSPSPSHIAAARHALGLTQQELGQRVGVNKLTVSRWECGAMKPGPAALGRLRRVLSQAKRKGVLVEA